MTALADVPALLPVTRHALIVPLTRVEWRDSGNPDAKDETTMRGHAAVFNQLSEDLGGFRELIAPGAFRAVLRTSPDVRLLYNHDPNYVLARTASGSLELREDGEGLHVFARVDRRISWVDDLRRTMLRGDVDQMSFAFDIEDDGYTWAVADNGDVVATVRTDGISALYDTSVVTYPAYTASRVNIRSTQEDYRSLLDHAVKQGLVPGIAPPGGADQESRTSAGSGSSKRLAALRAQAQAAVTTHTKEPIPDE